MMQEIVIGLIFAGAAVYLGRLIYRQVSKPDCASGCGKCNTVDFKKIEKQLEKRLAGKPRETASDHVL